MNEDDPKALVARGYDVIAERYAAWRSTGEDVKAKYIARARELAPAGAALLDLGCGTGEQVTRHLTDHFAVTGVDISPRSTAIARAALPGVSFVVGDMATVSLPEASYDVVTAFFSLIHLPRDEHLDVLRRIRGWLRPGGHLIVTMSAGDGGEGAEEDWLGAPMYWSNWDAATNRELITRAGLELVDAVEETEHEDGVPVTSLWVVARNPIRR